MFRKIKTQGRLRKEFFVHFEKLIELCSRMSGSFRTFPLKDRNPVSGKVKYRSINDPDKDMRKIHQLIMEYISGLNFPLPFATACRKGDSPRKNAERHRRNSHFYLTDLHDAYGSVRGARLADLFVLLEDSSAPDLRDRILSFLQKFCLSEKGGLIVGAPASPILFNLYAGEYLDKPLGQMCERWNILYTRYLDDLTFSSADGPIGKKKRRAIREAVKQAGFDVSHRKSQVYDLRKGTITINGVGLEHGGRIFCPRHYVRKVKGALHLRLGKKNPNLKMLSGMMGAFKNLTDAKNPNKTEKKLVRLAANRGIPRPKLYQPPPRRKEWWEKF